MSKNAEIDEAMAESAIARYNKQLIHMRGWLSGKGYYLAIQALEYAVEKHTGVRKDGYTPEFAHQIGIACYALTLLPLLNHPEETLATIFLHDVTEDCGVTAGEITRMFGNLIGEAVEILDRYQKTRQGGNEKDGSGKRIKQDVGMYYLRIHSNAIASIAKGLDRMHNMRTMVGVFTPQHQIRYTEELEEHILPMLKKARRFFPSQDMAYYNIKTVLELQAEAIRAMHGQPPAPWQSVRPHAAVAVSE